MNSIYKIFNAFPKISPGMAGIIAILIYIILSAAKGVYVGRLAQEVHPLSLTMTCFGITWIVFLVKERQVLEKVWFIKSKVVLLNNIATAGAWGFYYLSLRELEPAVSSAIVMGIGPLVVFALKKNERSIQKGIGATGIFLTLLGLVYVSSNGRTAIVEQSNTFLGLVAALISGISAALHSLTSKELNTAGYSPSEIMAVRFPLLIIGSVFTIFFADLGPTPTQVFQEILSHYKIIMIIAVFGQIIPLYACQIGIEKLAAYQAAMLLSLLPVAIIPFQWLDSRLSFSYYSSSGIILMVIIVSWQVSHSRPKKLFLKHSS